MLNALRAAARLIPPQTVVPILAGPARGVRWLAGASTPGFWVGRYERPLLERFAALLRPGMTVLDIGANAGVYSVLAAKRVGPKGRVYAIEPLPANAETIRRHSALNRFDIWVIEGAVSDKTEMAAFATGANCAEGVLAESGTLRVQTYTLDDLRAAHIIRRPDLIKIDVEGFEYRVLMGAAHVLREHPILFIELHHFSRGVRENTLTLLYEHGYAVEALDAESVEWASHVLARPVPRHGNSQPTS